MNTSSSEITMVLPDDGKGMVCASEDFVIVLIEAGKWVPYLKASTKNDHARYHIIPVSPAANEFLSERNQKMCPTLSKILMDCPQQPYGIRLSRSSGEFGVDHLDDLCRHFTQRLETWNVCTV